MKSSTKLILDIGLGAVVPILVLTYLTERIGAVPAYLLAALIPVGWVAIDLLAITRRFNFITSYVGATAILNGLLAFWFVDGPRFALKDSAAYIATTLAFGVSLLLSRPVLRYMFIQVQNPDTAARRAALGRLLDLPSVHRATLIGTGIVVAQNAILAVINFLLNYNVVTAAFGTDAFNQQVAQVNAITRIAFPLPAIAVMGLAIWLVFRATYRHLPAESGVPQIESDFWRLVELREAGMTAGGADARSSATVAAPAVRPSRAEASDT